MLYHEEEKIVDFPSAEAYGDYNTEEEAEDDFYEEAEELQPTQETDSDEPETPQTEEIDLFAGIGKE